VQERGEAGAGWSPGGARSLVRGFHVPLECSFDHLSEEERRVRELVVYCRVDCLPWASRDDFDFPVAAAIILEDVTVINSSTYTERRDTTNDSRTSCYYYTTIDIKVVPSAKKWAVR